MRIALSFLLVLAPAALAQNNVDQIFENLAIETLTSYTAALNGQTANCEPQTTACDKVRVAELRKELRTAVDRGRERDEFLASRLRTETDPVVVADLAKRHVALLTALAPAEKALGGQPAADAEKVEKDLIARIEDLVPSIKTLNAACEKAEETCNLERLAQERFELRDVMTRATTIDKKIMEDLKKAKLAETPALNARHLRLLAVLEPARDISFLVHEDRGEADELVDRVKALDKKLTDAEKESERAKRNLKDIKNAPRATAVTPTDVKNSYATGETLSPASNATRTSVEEAKKKVEEAKKKKEQVEEEAAELRTKLAELEADVRDQGIADRDRIAKIDDDLKSGKTSLKFGDLIAERESLSKRLAAIQDVVTLPAEGNPLYRVYDDDYEDWWVHQFYLGGEFDSVSGILNRGFARVGYSSWLHAGGENVPEAHPSHGFGNYGRHYIFNALLTSSAEQNISKLIDGIGTTDPCAPKTTAGAADKCIRRALETEQNFWFPIYRTRRHNRLRFYAGPMASIGATFVDPDQNDLKTLQAAYRYYGGIRTSFARDGFTEILFGKTSTLRSRRLEVRGEVPVAKWGAKSRLLLGWTANLRAGGGSNYVVTLADGTTTDVRERDAYRVYISYELDFLTLTGLTPPK